MLIVKNWAKVTVQYCHIPVGSRLGHHEGLGLDSEVADVGVVVGVREDA